MLTSLSVSPSPSPSLPPSLPSFVLKSNEKMSLGEDKHTHTHTHNIEVNEVLHIKFTEHKKSSDERKTYRIDAYIRKEDRSQSVV